MAACASWSRTALVQVQPGQVPARLFPTQPVALDDDPTLTSRDPKNVPGQAAALLVGDPAVRVCLPTRQA